MEFPAIYPAVIVALSPMGLCVNRCVGDPSALTVFLVSYATFGRQNRAVYRCGTSASVKRLDAG